MALTPQTISRISKLDVDLNERSFEDADRRRAAYRVALIVGADVARSRTMQVALLTAANICARCFPGAVSLHTPVGFDAELIVPFPIRSLRAAMQSLGVNTDATASVPDDVAGQLVFGTRPDVHSGLQVTFDGWIGAAGPVADGVRLQERDHCVLAGVLAGGLAAAEIFLRFSDINDMAGRRAVGLSLWRPDLHWHQEESVGPPAEYATGEYWLLGLGHLGQAYLWSLGFLPFEDSASVNAILQDIDKVEEPNVGTGLLTQPSQIGIFKTRVAERWLHHLGIHPRIVDRAFDERIVRADAEPRLALCGFDARGPRWALEEAGFTNIINCGVGGRADDFETIVMHTLPHPSVKAATEWPAGWADEKDDRIERLVRRNKVYRAQGEALRCGEAELAGQAVAVPFVGAVAASLVIAETMRMQQDGIRCGSLRLQLDGPDERIVRTLGTYEGSNQPRVAAQSLTNRGSATST